VSNPPPPHQTTSQFSGSPGRPLKSDTTPRGTISATEDIYRAGQSAVVAVVSLFGSLLERRHSLMLFPERLAIHS
jgi:hypothetical protein